MLILIIGVGGFELYEPVVDATGAVFCPLFSAFGPEPIRARLEIGCGVCLVTTRALFQRKIAAILDALPALRTVLLIDGTSGTSATACSRSPSRLSRPAGPT